MEIEAVITKLELDAAATIVIHTTQINDNVTAWIAILKGDAERFVAEFGADLQVEINIRIDAIRVSLDIDFNKQKKQIELYYIALINGLRDDGDSEVERERVIIVKWIAEQIKQIRLGGQKDIDAATVEINLHV